jgi:hypothetical protein
MKKLQSFVLNSDRREAFRTSALATLVALLAGTFWLVASPSAVAQNEKEGKIDEGADCTVCHKTGKPLFFLATALLFAAIRRMAISTDLAQRRIQGLAKSSLHPPGVAQ